MNHVYARRTQQEALELAKQSFRSIAEKHLSHETIEELTSTGILTGGTPDDSWSMSHGLNSTENDFYQFEIYKSKSEKPYVEKSYVRMLVSRNRGNESVYFQWNPENPK